MPAPAEPNTPDPPRLLSILSDQPAAEDRLNFDPYAKTLAEIIADPGTHTPLTIGIFGGWGQGKTSLMRMIERRLATTVQTELPVQSVWFNAWLYSQQPALWRALISRVLKGVRLFETLDDAAKAELDRLEHRLYGVGESLLSGHLTLPAGALPHLDSVALPPLLGLELLRRQADRAGKDDISRKLKTVVADLEAGEALTRRDQIAALDDFRREFERISEQHIANHGRLAVFVDDLDRCLPDKAVEVLEAVKLFLDVPGCVFILGVARDVIEEGIRVRYADYRAQLDGAHYLEKIIQIPFSLPPIAHEAVAGYVRDVTGGSLPDPRCETVFTAGLEPNPRRLKRTLNIFLLLWRLAQNREDLADAIKPVRLAKIIIIQQYHPRLFQLIVSAPYYLIDLEKRFREQGQRDLRPAGRPDAPGPDAEAETEADISAGPLADFLGRSLLRELLTCTAPADPDANFDDALGPAGVREYVYLTRSAVEEPAADRPAEAILPFEPQMVTIPAGPFLMGTPESELAEIEKLGIERKHLERETPQHEVTLPAYAIQRYPVTNAEFGRFIDEQGYHTRDYWPEAGWSRKESDGWTQPRFWANRQWNDPAQPVVGVSWYEAVAYANWLAAKTNRPYRLPAEAEWEKAARGSDGRRYPWEGGWQPDRCNNKTSGPGRTTPVGQYSPAGDSPFGVGDMVGQVWEWCSSKYGGTEDRPQFGYPYRSDDGREDLEGTDTRILRGGSWYNAAVECRCGYRDRSDPGNRVSDGGFRLARRLSS
ncbi:MAG: SUMF1/EgtB/PvdO family nonheme iron enzyme [Anaerolineaceae bacterium]|nr:SUMF1/EgtB/PvdO family nonheme iron enzyme [Anaerolineaceae bacterium]